MSRSRSSASTSDSVLMKSVKIWGRGAIHNRWTRSGNTQRERDWEYRGAEVEAHRVPD